MTEEYDSLVCEYKRVKQYMIDQETQIEEIRNNNYCIILMNYLEVNKQKAQMNQNNIFIDDFNTLVDEKNRLDDKYNFFHEEATTYVRTLVASLDNANKRCNKKV